MIITFNIPHMFIGNMPQRGRGAGATSHRAKVPFSLAWDSPCAAGAALKRQKERNRKGQSSLVVKQVKDPVLSLLWHGFDPWPGKGHMPQAQQKKN